MIDTKTNCCGSKPAKKAGGNRTRDLPKKVENPPVGFIEESSPVAGDNFDDSFYKGKGGCYTLDEFGRRVPVTQ